MPGIQLIVRLQLPAACRRESVSLHLSSPSVVPSLLSPAASRGPERNFYVPAPGQSWTRSTLHPPACILLQSKSGPQTTSIEGSCLIFLSYSFALIILLFQKVEVDKKQRVFCGLAKTNPACAWAYYMGYIIIQYIYTIVSMNCWISVYSVDHLVTQTNPITRLCLPHYWSVSE